MKIATCFILFAFILASCSEQKKSTEEQFVASLDTLSQSTVEKDTLSTAGDVIASLPSPIEMSSLIKASGAEYSDKILNNPDNQSKYTTAFSKSINLGIYGADLGYINIYGKAQNAINFLRVVKDIAEDLKVGQFFDFNTLSRLAKNNENVDSLLYLTTSGFEKMDQYLKDKKRGNISALILTGAWFEGLYLATQVASKTSNKTLIERVGEQKISFNDLLKLLNNYKSDQSIADIFTDLEKLKLEFDKVVISYQYSQPTTQEVDGLMVVVDNSSSTITITPEQLKAITKLTEEIRNKLIS